MMMLLAVALFVAVGRAAPAPDLGGGRWALGAGLSSSIAPTASSNQPALGPGSAGLRRYTRSAWILELGVGGGHLTDTYSTESEYLGGSGVQPLEASGEDLSGWGAGAALRAMKQISAGEEVQTWLGAGVTGAWSALEGPVYELDTSSGKRDQTGQLIEEDRQGGLELRFAATTWLAPRISLTGSIGATVAAMEWAAASDFVKEEDSEGKPAWVMDDYDERSNLSLGLWPVTGLWIHVLL